MSIGNYLTELDNQRDQLARNLVAMGVQASQTEKLNTLVPKVLQIPQTKPDVTLFRASIATVIGQAHWHHNLTTLNGITESHVSRWNEAYTAAMNLNERVGVNEGVFERFKTEILYDMQGAKTSITDIYTRLEAVEAALSGVEEALSNIVEVTA